VKAFFGFAFFILFLAAFALVLLKARQTAELAAEDAEAPFTDVRWRPVAVGGERFADDTRAFLTIGADGTVSGDAGCNRFSGTLTRTDAGIELGPLATTRRACPEPVMRQEAALLMALETARELRAEGDVLRLLGQGADDLARFVAAPE
jgi:putative lipoprotein